MRVGSLVRVVDNSGVCYIRVIKVLKAGPRANAKIASIVIGSVILVNERKKFKVEKGSIVRAICIRLADTHTRKIGLKFRFLLSTVVCITRNGLPRGNLIYGPVPKELRELGYIRLVSCSTLAI